MKLNRLGRASMNNVARATLQRRVTAAHLKRLGRPLEGGRALEIGCGRGLGVEIILDVFDAAHVLAIDLDWKMVDQAQRRLRSRSSLVNLVVADATAIPALDASFDAVFDFGAIHLVTEWPRALSEVRRVLRPGGQYFFELVTSRVLRAPYPLFTEGFERMGALRQEEFLAELRRRRIAVEEGHVERLPLVALSGFVGDLVGVGTAVP